MFRLDQDPTVFDLNHNSEDLNNRIDFPNMMDILSDDYIGRPEEIDMIQELGLDFYDDMKKEEESEAALIQVEPAVTVTQNPTPLFAPVMVKQEKQRELKIEDTKFDLIQFVIGEEYISLTPEEEKACPTFNGVEIDPQQLIAEVKTEPEPQPSTSAGPSRKPSTSDSDYNVRPKRQISRKRRYSSDSDFSIGTSASSYNDTRQKKLVRKRGRPAKELITNLPTIEDFKNLPKEQAEFLVLRIKNNEASRKSRMKSKNEQDMLEDECMRLEKRREFLKAKRQKLEDDIGKLRSMLLAAA